MLLNIKRGYHLVKTGMLRALPAAVANGWPEQELQIYGITGTDGKTTSSSLLYHALSHHGYPAALISTVGAVSSNQRSKKQIETGLHTTSPQPNVLFKLLRQFADSGVKHVVLEVTSHGLWQYRVWGIPFSMAGITNVTKEHLDYFEDWETLVKVKSELLTKSKHAFINQDDDSFPLLVEQLQRSHTDFTAYKQTLPSEKVVAQAIQNRFLADYNQWNANLVWQMCQRLGMSPEGFAQAVATFPGVPGRMEVISEEPVRVIVDFAHTSNGLKHVLQSLNKQTKGRLIAVYGSAGERDRQKRPVMGEIGARLADLVVLTAEDPRSEKVEVIIRQMKEGIPSGMQNKVASVADRREAIKFALSKAKKGDTVAILGKGHEQSMCYGKQEIPWSDAEVVKELLATNIVGQLQR